MCDEFVYTLHSTEKEGKCPDCRVHHVLRASSNLATQSYIPSGCMTWDSLGFVSIRSGRARSGAHTDVISGP
jgi:hypothetical protein